MLALARRIPSPTVEVDTRQLVRELREELRTVFRPEPANKRTLAEISAEWLPRKLRKIPASAVSFESRVRLHLLPVGKPQN